jgi:hypothetical protein
MSHGDLHGEKNYILSHSVVTKCLQKHFSELLPAHLSAPPVWLGYSKNHPPPAINQEVLAADDNVNLS